MSCRSQSCRQSTVAVANGERHSPAMVHVSVLLPAFSASLSPPSMKPNQANSHFNSFPALSLTVPRCFYLSCQLSFCLLHCQAQIAFRPSQALLFTLFLPSSSSHFLSAAKRHAFPIPTTTTALSTTIDSISTLSPIPPKALSGPINTERVHTQDCCCPQQCSIFPCI